MDNSKFVLKANIITKEGHPLVIRSPLKDVAALLRGVFLSFTLVTIVLTITKKSKP